MSAVRDASSLDPNRRLLEAAGYVFNAKLNLWNHDQLDRALDGDIAAALTTDQLSAWIAAGLESRARVKAALPHHPTSEVARLPLKSPRGSHFWGKGEPQT